MRKNLDAWLFQQDAEEGGVSNRPLKDDPGGYTKYGITAATLSAELKRPATIHDFDALTVEDAHTIAAKNYWGPVCGDQLPGGVDVMVSDCAYNSGPEQAVELLQQVLGFDECDVDGDVGPKTLAAAKKAEPSKLIKDYADARMEFLRGLHNWEANKNGWTKRIKHMKELSYQLAEPIPALPSATPMRQSKIAWGSGVSGVLAAATLAYSQAQGIEEPLRKVLAALGVDPNAALGIGALLILAASGVSWLARRADHKTALAIEAQGTAP